MIVSNCDETGDRAVWMDGRELARAMFKDLASQFAQLTSASGAPVRLAIVQVGQDAAASSYVRAIVRSCDRVGVTPRLITLASEASPIALADTLHVLAGDSETAGIIIQYPLPEPLAQAVRAHIPAHKDVDGIHPLNAGLLALGDPSALVPATPLGGMALLHHYNVDLEGKHAVVIGRSPVVGRPMAQLLLQAHATVTICHSRTQGLGEMTRSADILAVATGRPRMVTAAMVKKGATVIDFGVNFVDGQTVGDVDTEPVAEIAARITPVPGGTGPMTNVMLMQNTLDAAKRQRSQD